MRTVPESFDSMLAELADAAVSITPLPDLADVRRRARQRTNRRRAFASALALILIGGSAGTVAAVTHKEAPTSSVGTMSSGAASATPSPSASPSTTQSPAAGVAGVASKAYEPLVGLWELKDGTQRYLIVYPDGLLGIGQAGGWAMCFGQVAAPSAGAFALTGVACSDFGTTGLSLAPNADDSMLTLSVSARGSAAAYTEPFVRAPDITAVAIDEKNSQVLGTWMSASADKRTLVITSDGMMAWSGVNDTGAVTSGNGMMEGLYYGGVRYYVECGDKVDPYKVCGLFQVVPVGVGKIIVYGSYGPEMFVRVSAAQGSATSSSATPSAGTTSFLSSTPTAPASATAASGAAFTASGGPTS